MRNGLTLSEKATLLDSEGITATLQATQEPEGQPAPDEKEQKPTQAKLLLELVKRTGATFFHSTMNDLYASIPVGDHTEVWLLDGRDFKIWLAGLYYKQTGSPIGNEAIKQAVDTLSASAMFDNPEPIELHTRTAEQNGSFWLDLSNAAWQAIKITPVGWSVCDNPPIMYARYRHQATQIIPQPGGDVKKILRHVNIKEHETLFLVWVVCSFVPGIPHPAIILFGEKGAAKSTACSLLKMLIDPSALETMTLQNDPRTLAVNLQQHWFLPFDNVSYINEETSDTLCRAVTGGGIQQRKLFTNAEDAIFTFRRCLALNGINNVATRPDLLDRSLLIELERITEADRRELAEIMAAFEIDRPAILGGILDTLSKAMAIFPSVKLNKLPRMADFTRWGFAIGEALGGKGQEFLDQYSENRETQNTEAINADPVATLVVKLMSTREVWTGEPSKLLGDLTLLATSEGVSTSDKSFPKRANQLSRRLRATKSNLEAVGITYENHGHGRTGTTISIKVKNSSSLPSHRHEPIQINTFSRDDNVTINSNNKFIVTPSSHSKPFPHNKRDDSDGSDDEKATFTEDYGVEVI